MTASTSALSQSRKTKDLPWMRVLESGKKKVILYELPKDDVPMPGPCAKMQVHCTIVTESGHHYHGENFCNTPQPVCPRAPGEGYEKCKTICHQEGHAETVAIASAEFAGDDLHGAHAYITGHDHFCRDCQIALFAAGVSALTVGSPP